MRHTNNTVHPDFLIAQEYAYQPNGLIATTIVPGLESSDYGACSFTMNNKFIEFRVAKITPTKIGQFVTLWKRIGSGPIMPYDLQDPVDLFVVNVKNDTQMGQFIFPKELLCQKGFISKNGIGGKRAMRVYPPWDRTDNPQAQKSQTWQLLYFVEIQPTRDNTRIKQLFL